MPEKKQDWSHWRVFKTWVLLWHNERMVGDGPALVAVFSSHDKALEGAASIIYVSLERDNRLSIDEDERKAVAALLQVGSLEEAMDRYQEAVQGQTFEIFERDVDSMSEPT